jgi:hypothetical protein
MQLVTYIVLEKFSLDAGLIQGVLGPFSIQLLYVCHRTEMAN